MIIQVAVEINTDKTLAAETIEAAAVVETIVVAVAAVEITTMVEETIETPTIEILKNAIKKFEGSFYHCLFSIFLFSNYPLIFVQYMN